MQSRTIALVVALLISTPVMAQSFTEGFDSGLPTSGNQASPGLTVSLPSGNWFAINASNPIGTLGYVQGTGDIFPAHAGSSTNSYLSVWYLSGADVSNLNAFFMSPTVTFRNGDTISFFSRTVDDPGFPDRLNLKLSLNGSSTAITDFTTNLLTINSGLTLTDYPVTWTQFSVVLSGLSGPTSGRFAFNYDVPNGGPLGDNSDYIGIDTVSYSSIAVPEPTTIVFMGLVVLASGLAWRYRRHQRRAMLAVLVVEEEC
jgi:hypothetical protein